MTQSINHILKTEFNYNITGTLWIECNGARFFGPGRVELLERIVETGSINKAAKQMGMSYKKAWEMINALNAHTKKPVVIPHAGGKKGGGTVVTPEALELISFHKSLRERFKSFLEQEAGRLHM